MSDKERNSSGHDAIIAKQVASGLVAASRLIQSLATDIKDNSIAIATLKTEVNSLKSDVKSISEMLLRDERGNRPVMTRLALLEQLSTEIEEQTRKLEITSAELSIKVETIARELDTKSEERKQEETARLESKKNRVQIIVALLTSIGALIAAALGAILK